MDGLPGAALVVVGLGLVWVGFSEGDRRPGLVGAALAWLAPLGVLMALAGSVLVFVPDFFAEVPAAERGAALEGAGR